MTELDFRTIDAVITGAILVCAIIGAMLAYTQESPALRRAGAFGYLAIVASIGPVFTARAFGPGGLGVISAQTQVMLLAFGHTFALVLVLTLLIVTVKRIRRHEHEGEMNGMD